MESKLRIGDQMMMTFLSRYRNDAVQTMWEPLLGGSKITMDEINHAHQNIGIDGPMYATKFMTV